MRPSRSLPTALQHPINTGQTRASNRIQPGRSAKHQQRPPNQANFNEFLDKVFKLLFELKDLPRFSPLQVLGYFSLLEMYAYRSAIAHGGTPNFTGELAVLGKAENANALISEAVKKTILQAIEEPQLLADLHDC